jgi:glycosyltransferase involved in cell wall biosynthesis
MLCDAFRQSGRPHDVIDFGSRLVRADGETSAHRLGSLVRPLLSSLQLPFAAPSNVYLTTSQSWPGFLKDLVFIACARLGRHRIVLHRHGGGYQDFYHAQTGLRRALIRHALGAADRLVVLGQALSGMYAFLPDYRDKVVVVHNGLPEDLPDWERVLATKARAGDEIRILYLSNLIESKGYLDVLEAVRRLVHDHGLDVRADFAGEFWFISDSQLYSSADQAQADFLARLQSYGLHERVAWHGRASGDFKRELLARAHYFVLPTAYKYEGQPVSIIEAMAYGALVVSTAFRAIPEMLNEGRAGLLVEPGRPQQIVDAVLGCRVGSADYRARIATARQRCGELFSRERYLDRRIAVIEDDPQAGGAHHASR